MKHSICTFIVSVIVSTTAFGQTASTVRSNEGILQTVPQEKVFVHYNESLLFSGEHLLYKIYALDTKTRKLTHISKIAYVSLVDKNGDAVFTHKVRLKEGAGYGDFFVPTSVSTGSYKLLGYTQWMKNFGQENFFQSNVHIINPYQPIPEAHLVKVADSSQATVDSPEPRISAANVFTADQNGPIQVSLDKSQLGVREKLTLQIAASDHAIQKGNYTLSIRKMGGLNSPEKMDASSFVRQYLNGNQNNSPTPTTLNLPEIRGEVVSGIILNKGNKNPAKDVRVSISLPGSNYLFNVAVTDEQGRFRFLLDQEYDNVTGAIQLLVENWDNYEVLMDEAQKEYAATEVTDLVIPESMGDYILKKSIQNQIENGFREVKSDAVIPADHEQPFYRNFTVNYNLDDYTRFNSIQETVVEVIDQLSVRRLDNGERAFEIRPEEGFTDLALLPMVFVDGLFIKRHEDFMDYSAKKIQSIHFSRDKVILGPQIFQGVLHIKTIEGNFYNDFYTPHIVNLNLFKPQPRKKHFNQTHNEGSGQERIPDFRHQLFWEPNLDLSDGSKEVVLYTSDVPGDYLLILEGFSSTGNPVSVKRGFKVQ